MKKRILVTLLAMVMVFSMAFSMTGCGDDAEATWADKYVALLDSGEARDYEGYDEMKAVLDDIRIDIGATYVYVLTPAGEDGTPDPAGAYGEDGAYLITVDGSEEPDDWGVDYGWEVQFTEAWEGTPSSARSAWDNYGDGYCWSAFAPVYDSEGNVVCLLGVDYPCTEVIEENPEWNRDGDVFNGFHDEITGEVPTAVANMRQLVTDYATKAAAQLSGQMTWADQYVALLASGEARDYADYDAMKAELDDIRIASGATYVYVLTPAAEDGTTPSETGVYTEDGAFLITVDGSEEPDDWGVDYGWEVQFTEAWEGTPSSARSAWDNYGDGYCWSGFAPVYASTGEVVCLLGFDYPCTEVIEANPEWNRDGDVFNGFHDEITGEVPQDVADMREFVTDLAAKYAKAL